MRSRRQLLGQNFLTDPTVAGRIVDRFSPGPEDQVLEVGPGPGILTDLVAGHVGHLVAVEKDAGLAADLQQRYGSNAGVTIVHGDMLKVSIDSLPLAGGPVRVLSNLPYSVATAIIERLLGWGRVEDLVVMVQKEVAERMTAPAGTRERGYLSVLVGLHCEVEKAFEVPPGAFRPPPKVRSTVLTMKVRAADPEEVAGVLRVASAGFASRRKTLYNNLRSGFRLSRDTWDSICSRAALDPRVRAEDLDLASWKALHKALLPEVSVRGNVEDPLTSP